MAPCFTGTVIWRTLPVEENTNTWPPLFNSNVNSPSPTLKQFHNMKSMLCYHEINSISILRKLTNGQLLNNFSILDYMLLSFQIKSFKCYNMGKLIAYNKQKQNWSLPRDSLTPEREKSLDLKQRRDTKNPNKWTADRKQDNVYFWTDKTLKNLWS